MNIATFLHATARCHPQAPALAFGDELVWRWEGLQTRVARLAGGLRAVPGMMPGDRIGLAMKNCPQYIELMWAAWHAGLCVVPMNAKLHPKEFAFILQNCGVRVCFTTPDLTQALVEESAAGGATRIVDVDGADYAAFASALPIPMQSVLPAQQAWLFYTSGTTGRPKGATLTHGSLLAMTLRYYADVDALGTTDCMIHCAPLSHASGLYSLPHVAKGSLQVIPASQGFDPAELFELVGRYPNATFFTAPTMMMRLVAHPGVRAAPIERIRTVFYGGAPMYLENLKEALSVLGPRLWQGYGQGETPNTITCMSKAMHVDDGHPRFEQRLASVGVARTGDLGVFDEDGFLTLKDRSKDVIISGGSNIYPREVEEALLQHPDVLEVSVIGARHADWGEEVIAFVVPKAGRSVSDEDLDRLCLENIARFKRPKRYLRIDELPKSPYGKVLKTALRDRLAGG